MARWYQLGLAAMGAIVACASAPESSPESPGVPGEAAVVGAIAKVEVSFAPGVAAGLDADQAKTAARAARQSALDWLEEAGRFDPRGGLEVRVLIDSLHLRGATVTWLFASLADPDHLAARASVSRDGTPVLQREVRVESGLAGYDWRAPDERLERLARRLGHRLATRLVGSDRRL